VNASFQAGRWQLVAFLACPHMLELVGGEKNREKEMREREREKR
jgi:hypothetical protein